VWSVTVFYALLSQREKGRSLSMALVAAPSMAREPLSALRLRRALVSSTSDSAQ
jgi:hypothetical protein